MTRKHLKAYIFLILGILNIILNITDRFSIVQVLASIFVIALSIHDLRQK